MTVGTDFVGSRLNLLNPIRAAGCPSYAQDYLPPLMDIAIRRIKCVVVPTLPERSR
jgi:hypothetical protein